MPLEISNKMNQINIIVYQVEKPLNLGNIMRTCAAFGYHLHIIGPLTYDLENPEIKRASLDYINNLNMTYHKTWISFKKLNTKAQIHIITRYGNKTPDQVNFTKNNVFLMFGKESTGIPRSIMNQHPTRWIRVPIKPFARALNLSNTVAMLSYEIARQNKYSDLATFDNLKNWK
jgi:tRNA (cytidine/uridine-2'-O-)-methyltransferase